MLGLVLAAGCQTSAPVPAAAATGDEAVPGGDLAAGYRALAGEGSVWQVEAQGSSLRFHVFRGGKAARAGHNHVVEAAELEGYLHLPTDDPTRARFDLRVPLGSLRIDDPALRAATGGAFAGERSATDLEGTRKNMLGPRGLDAERFPVAHIRSLAVAGDWPLLAAQVEVLLHGQRHVVDVPMHVERAERRLTIAGSLVLRQTDFGIKPYSLFGGLLAVQDAVVVTFDLVVVPIEAP